MERWFERREAQRRAMIAMEETRIEPVSETLPAVQPTDVIHQVCSYRHMLPLHTQVACLDDLARAIEEAINRYYELFERMPAAVWTSSMNKALYSVYLSCHDLPAPEIPMIGDRELLSAGMVRYVFPVSLIICTGD